MSHVTAVCSACDPAITEAITRHKKNICDAVWTFIDEVDDVPETNLNEIECIINSLSFQEFERIDHTSPLEIVINIGVCERPFTIEDSARLIELILSECDELNNIKFSIHLR